MAAASDARTPASTPAEMPRRGWSEAARRIWAEVKQDNVPLLSAGVGFYALLALVPALVACVSIYGTIADPEEVADQVVRALAAAPEEVRSLVASQLEAITRSTTGENTIAATVGILLALWSASAGIGHLIVALDVAYDVEDRRGFVRRKLLALAFTLGATMFVVVSIAVIAILPSLLADTGLGRTGRVTAGVVRWIVLFGGMLIGLALLYRFGPARRDPVWRWVSPGAVVAAVVWSVGSLAFSVYTANFASYNETYGSLGAIVVVMLWLYITALAVLLGAEVNAEVERQAALPSSPDRDGPERDGPGHDGPGHDGPGHDGPGHDVDQDGVRPVHERIPSTADTPQRR